MTDNIDFLSKPNHSRTQPGFMAFSRLLHSRITTGRSLEVLFMLKEIGACSRMAYEILDGWPTREEDRRAPKKLGLTIAEEAAYRFAVYCRNLEEADWVKVMNKAMSAVPVRARGK